MSPPVLILGWGNLSRGDDALGPLLLDALHTSLPDHLRDHVEFLDEFQLQIEHALDLLGRRHVLLVDASLTASAPFEVSQPHPVPDASYTTHALSPEGLLHLYQELHATAPPPCTLLAIRGERFELGEAPSAQALQNLDAALRWVLNEWLYQVFTAPDLSATAP
ncbi:hydrogenase maturation protease [Rhodoferax sp. 4810]|nr:hydrogenase maturation protease [Rhodoferax jenense]